MGAVCCPPTQTTDLDRTPPSTDKSSPLVSDETILDMKGSPLFDRDRKIGLEDFKVEKVIGRGSFGKVYMVTKKDTG